MSPSYRNSDVAQEPELDSALLEGSGAAFALGCVGGEEDADRFAGEPVPLGAGGTLVGVELGPVLRYGQDGVGEVRSGEAGVVGCDHLLDLGQGGLAEHRCG